MQPLDKIHFRQSEIRSELMKMFPPFEQEEPVTEELRAKGKKLEAEYLANEERIRAEMRSKDTTAPEASPSTGHPNDAESLEWRSLVQRYEVRQVIAALSSDRPSALEGATKEVVDQMTTRGKYAGIPVPWEAFGPPEPPIERRVGETVAAGVASETAVMPILDRLFAPSAVGRMGIRVLNIAAGAVEWPITAGGATVGWAASETANVGGPAVFSTTERTVKPDYTVGAQMHITRKTLKSSGEAIEAVVRRDMLSAIQEEIDKVAFLGKTASNQPKGLALTNHYEMPTTAVTAAASFDAIFDAAVEFFEKKTITSPKDINILIRVEVYKALVKKLVSGTAISDMDRLKAEIGRIVTTATALPAPTGTPAASTALMTTTTGGVPPGYVAIWGGVDVIRDPITSAASGALKLTGIVTLDVTAVRADQSRILTGIQ